MINLPDPIQKLIKLWSKLPGIGEKTARRMVFYVLSQDKQWIKDFSKSLLEIAENIHHCSECGNITDRDLCTICTDKSRNSSIICVVETDEDCVAIEQAGIYNGLYHVLGGHISPLEDEELPKDSLKKLIERIRSLNIKEVILATTPRIEGDLTAFTVQEYLNGVPVKISRLSYGLPVGGSIGFADRVTLHMALESRKEM
ncbi:MAG: recombination mediator RecR [Synergistaceae bacterium]